VILHCTFEELSALSAGAERVLAESGAARVVVAAPAEIVADLEALTPRLIDDLSVTTLAEQRSIARAIAYVVADLKIRMDASIIGDHAAGESAVQAYFEYAHVLTMEDRVRRLGSQMSALIELMTGAPATDESARLMAFPD
jgi:phosphate uptake regulator